MTRPAADRPRPRPPWQHEQGGSKFSKLAWLETILRSDLDGTTKLVGATLGTYARSRDGENAHPGRKRLAEDLNVSTSTIDRALKRLVSLHWVDRLTDGRAAPKRDWADEYRLLLAVDQSSPVSTGQGEVYSVDQSSPVHDQSSNVPDQSSQLCRPIRSSTYGYQIHPSASSDAASTPVEGRRARTREDDYHVMRDDFDAFTDWLERNGADIGAPGFDATVESMWDRGVHPKAILNTLRRMQL